MKSREEIIYYTSIILLGITFIIGITFKPKEFTDRCDEHIYVLILYTFGTFFSVIPMYYETDVEEKPFRAPMPSSLPGGTSFFFVVGYVVVILTVKDILKENCFQIIFNESIFNLILISMVAILFLIINCIFVLFIIKLVKYIRDKEKEYY